MHHRDSRSEHTLCHLQDGKQPISLDDIVLFMHLFGFNKIELKALFGQQRGENAHAFTGSLHQLIVLTKPTASHSADVPRSVAPGQKPIALSIHGQVLTTILEELDRDNTHWKLS